MYRAMAARENILLFDSGLGGLTVFREVAAARPEADYVYVADDAAFPYGAIEEHALVARVVALMGELAVAPRGVRLRSGFVILGKTDFSKGRRQTVLRPFFRFGRLKCAT